MLGHIENNGPRNKLTGVVRLTRFLAGVVEYIHRKRDDTPLYHSYRSDDEKRLRKNKRAAAARKARKLNE